MDTETLGFVLKVGAGFVALVTTIFIIVGWWATNQQMKEIMEGIKAEIARVEAERQNLKKELEHTYGKEYVQHLEDEAEDVIDKVMRKRNVKS